MQSVGFCSKDLLGFCGVFVVFLFKAFCVFCKEKVKTNLAKEK